MAQTKRGKTSAPAKKTRAKPAQSKPNASKAPRRREISAIICLILSLFSFIGYFNSEGAFIGFFIRFVKSLVGHGYFVLPPALLLCSIILSFHRGRPVRFRVVCTLILTVAFGALMHLFASKLEYEISFGMVPELWKDGGAMLAGGAVSGSLAVISAWLFGRIGTAVVFVCVALFLLLVSFNLTVAGIADAYRKRERREYIPEPEPDPGQISPRQRALQAHVSKPPKWKKAIDIPLDDEEAPTAADRRSGKQKNKLFKDNQAVITPDQYLTGVSNETDASAHEVAGISLEHAEPGSRAVSENTQSPPPEEIIDIPLDIPFMEGKRERAERLRAERDRALDALTAKTTDLQNLPDSQDATASQSVAKPGGGPAEPRKTDADAVYIFPPVELLSIGAPNSRAGDDEVRMNSERLEAAFRSFGVNVNISNATRGPAVTRYEAELEAGIKLSKLTGLADDIALSLGTSGVRIAAMPNKISTVGIEVPNKNISKVYLRDIIESQAYVHAKSKLTFAVGMDISGDAIVGSISKLPHMLVAGTTGSGKSVCLNSIIISILYKATPDDVRFIMIDPKMVEFKVYNDIPHLLVPVVTDVKKAAGALQWAVFEMMKRYTLFSETNARDIEGYNQIARKAQGERDPLPQVIVVIDELADLMLMAAKEVEESVCRVAQMGRAAGMHLIIATQSPRADVITGLMKANIPSRIAFKVSSALESRIILDAGGNADKLVGNGDMLYSPIGIMKPMRVQGTWVSDKEREKIVEFIKKRGETQYSEEVMGEIEKAAVDKSKGEQAKDEPEGGDHDELLPQAVDVIFETGQASVSMLQRRLKLGYSRAARIVDQMEQMGIVGPFEGSKPRAMLITRDQWRQMQYLSGNAPVDRSFQDRFPPSQDFDDDE